MRSYNTNMELNVLDAHQDKKCTHCGRKYPLTVLNVEGVIHHGRDYVCLNTGDCNRYKKKRR